MQNAIATIQRRRDKFFLHVTLKNGKKKRKKFRETLRKQRDASLYSHAKRLAFVFSHEYFDNTNISTRVTAAFLRLQQFSMRVPTYDKTTLIIQNILHST